MDVRFPSSLASVPGLGAPTSVAKPAEGGPTQFAGALQNALQHVSRLQTESTQLQQQFQLGAEGVTLEQTMVAMQTAQVGFQAAMTVRNRLVSAYTDIMNMQV
ncbi:MAG: flagellar hook-basal body complex protein FliE [Burkholderiaceae bacterium]